MPLMRPIPKQAKGSREEVPGVLRSEGQWEVGRQGGQGPGASDPRALVLRVGWGCSRQRMGPSVGPAQSSGGSCAGEDSSPWSWVGTWVR